MRYTVDVYASIHVHSIKIYSYLISQDVHCIYLMLYLICHLIFISSRFAEWPLFDGVLCVCVAQSQSMKSDSQAS